jgi:hypothetical protein
MLAEALTALASTGGTALVTLGPDHPDTKITVEWVDYLVGLRNGLSDRASGLCAKSVRCGMDSPP